MPLPAFAPPVVAFSTAAGHYALAWLIGRSALSRIDGLHTIERAAGSILLGLFVQAAIAFVLACVGELQPTTFLIVAGLTGAASLCWRARPASTPSEPNLASLPR